MALRARKTQYDGGFFTPHSGVAKPRPNVKVKPTTGARSLAEVLLARHRGMGMPEIRRPFKDVSDAPEVPQDITTLSDKDLSTLYGRLDAFAAFVGYRLAEAEDMVRSESLGWSGLSRA